MIALSFSLSFLSRVCDAAYVLAGQPPVTSWQPLLLASDVMRLFSVGTAIMFLVSQAVLGAGAVISNHGALASTVRALDEVAHLIGHLSTLPLGSFVLAAGLAQRVARRGARWIAWFGIATGTTLIATTSWVAIRQQWLHNAGVFALLAFLVWIAACSVSLLRIKRIPGVTTV